MTALDPQPPKTSTGRQEPWRDGKGQYRFTKPDGALRSYTRSTTIADTLEEKLKLHEWEQRMMAKGLADSPDLITLLQGHDPNEDRQVFERACQTALARAKTDEAANTGTALHRWTELYDLGQTDLNSYPPDVRNHVHAYARKLEHSGFEVVPAFIEQIVIDDNHNFGGQIDRALRATRDHVIHLPRFEEPIHLAEGELIVGDLKTGKLALYKNVGYSTQVTGYANHTHTWHVDHDHEHGGTRGERLDVSRDVALIIHLPATDPAAPCTLHWVDLRLGLEYFQASIEVRGLRSAPYKRMLVTEYEVEEPLEDQTNDWIKGRVRALIDHSPAAVQDLEVLWPETAPRKGLGVYQFNDQEIGHLALVCDELEAKYQIPFGQPRPGGKQTTGYQTGKHRSN